MPRAQAERLFAEWAAAKDHMEYRPWVGHSEHPIHLAAGLNVDASDPIPIRRTVTHLPEANGAKRVVWIFGGSTSFGVAVPDDQTIAAHLARSLHARGIDAQVINHGHLGYFSSQELALMQWLLRAGERADVVVFIDGLNESWQRGDLPFNTDWVENAIAQSRRPVSVSTKFGPARFFKGLIAKVAGKRERIPEIPPAQLPKRAAEMAALYFDNVRLARSSAALFGVKTLFVWQPTPFDFMAPMSSDPREWRVRESWSEQPVIKPLNQIVSQKRGEYDVTFLADRFAGRPFLETYVDNCHYGDESSRLLAEAIAGEIVGRNWLADQR